MTYVNDRGEAGVANVGDAMNIDLVMEGHRITGLAKPTKAQETSTKAYASACIEHSLT